MYYDEVLDDGTTVPAALQDSFRGFARQVHYDGCCEIHGEDTTLYRGVAGFADVELITTLPMVHATKASAALRGYAVVARQHTDDSPLCRHYEGPLEPHEDPNWINSGLAADLVSVLRS